MRFTLVKSKNGVQPPQTSCDFAPPGGTIGRSEDNNFTLPDENRAISRLQALVHISAEGECRLTNRGNVINVEFNGIPLERGRQVELQDGDQLGIGDYLIAVSSLHQNTAPHAESVKNPNPLPSNLSSTATANVPGEIWDSLADEFSVASTAETPDHAAVQAHKASDNPLTELAREELNPTDPLSQVQNPASLHQLNKRETDPTRLFTADSPFEQEHILKNSTPSTLLTHEALPTQSGPAQQQEIDPLALFGGASSSAENSDPFGLMVDNAQPLTPPEHFQAAPAEPEPLPPPQIKPQPAAVEQIVEAPLIPLPVQEPSPAPEEKIAPQPSLSAGRMSIDPVSYQRQPARQKSHDNAMLEGNLLQGLLEGIGLNEMHNQPEFGEEQLRLLGQVVSLFSQGTVALLSSRSMLKRGVKAEMTMILDEANNPFKLLPSGKTVLMQMFGTQMPGFMQPEQAVRDALIDLQAHQLGMIAGIRAIIAAMLQSFNPELLEIRAREEGQLPRMALSTKRKAALWDYFIKNYQKTSGEIEDDFHTLFGEAFLHAYDVEVDQYKDLQTKQGK